MKRRKPPILLVTSLVLMLVAVGLIYSPRNQGTDISSPPPNMPESGERPKITPNQVAAMASTSVKSPADQKTKAIKPGPAGPEGSGGPTITMAKPREYKPTPNETSTSSQWYTDEAKK